LDTADKSVAPATDLDKQKVLTSPLLSRLIALASTNDVGIAIGLLILCFATRLIAVHASLWEWDDILFAHSLHKYDIAEHKPHPPGFPVFVAMARVAFWALHDEHRALTTVGLIFASFLTPALFFFYREVFQDRRIAFAGALLGSFAPNVWVHSVGGRSDEVALTLGVIGLTLVIRGLRSRRSLIAGCALFGLAMGVRVTLLPVMGPVIALVFLARLRRREWKLVTMALATGTACVLVWFAPLIYHVTWNIYRQAMSAHSQYTIQIDSIFSNTGIGALPYRFRRFFIEIWGVKWIMHTIYALSVLGLVALVLKRQWRVIGWMALAFLPYVAFILTLNTPLSAPLYSLPYVPLFTGLAACGLVKVPDLVSSSEWRRTRKYLGPFLAAMVTLGMAGWTYPIIKLVHGEVSPPIKALTYLKKNFDAQHEVLYFSGNFTPHVSFYLPQVRLLRSEKIKNSEANLINPGVEGSRIIALTDYPASGELDEAFHWTSNDYGVRRLKRLSLGRYFDVYVTNVTTANRTLFLSGWPGQESNGYPSRRWLGRQSKVALFNAADSMVLRLRGVPARGPSGRLPTMALRLNGVEIYRQTLNSDEFDQSLTVKTDPQFMWYALTIEFDQTVNQSKLGKSNDNRDLSFYYNLLEWAPAPGAKLTAFAADQFLGPGWYGLEGEAAECLRWAEQRATIHLPPIEGNGNLELTMQTPIRPDGTIPEVTVEISGQVIDKFRPADSNWFTKSIRVPEAVHHGARADLVLSTDNAMVLPNGGNRRIGAAVCYIAWRPGE
jgi:hypothetical protein